ncbi:MAG: sigma 54-interacting transcriptional regulator [Microvirga sp.]
MPLTSLLTASIRALRAGDPGDAAAFAAERFIRQADRAARTGAPVLIDGEPGCGADALARAIHACGERSDGPFVLWRADAPDDAGAATLARHLADAAGGTLLIRSAHALEPGPQSGLLRHLREREAGDAPGRRRSGPAPARIIAAAHGPVIDRVRAGTFRADLFYRLDVVSVHLPRLGARRDLVLPAARFLAARFAADEGRRITGLAPEAEALLDDYPWPGNLRQLENAVLRAVLLATGSRLTPAEFPQIAARTPGYRVEIPLAPMMSPASGARLAELSRSAGPAPDARALRLVDESGGLRSLGDLEAEIIRFALNHCGGHISAVSRHLGIGRSTLYRKLRDLGLADAVSDADAMSDAAA